ncbi:hypothetical protein JCM11491_007037 [Sporobolomyces phaffii]
MPRPPLVLSRYLSPSSSSGYLRAPLYYLTWLVYYLTYLVSPAFLTVLQLVAIAIDHLSPRLERAIRDDLRPALTRSTWAQPLEPKPKSKSSSSPPSSSSSSSSLAAAWNSITRWWNPHSSASQTGRPSTTTTTTLKKVPAPSASTSSVPVRVPTAHAGRLGSTWTTTGRASPRVGSPPQTVVTLSNGTLFSLCAALVARR